MANSGLLSASCLHLTSSLLYLSNLFPYLSRSSWAPNLKKAQKSSKIVKNRQKRVKNGQKWPKTPILGQKPQKCPKRPKNGQNVPNWGPKRTLFCSRLYGKSRFGNGSIIHLRRPPYPPKMAKKVTFLTFLGVWLLQLCCNDAVVVMMLNRKIFLLQWITITIMI